MAQSNFWKRELESDKATVRALIARIPEAQAGNSKLGPEELQAQILAVYRVRKEMDRMRDKYEASLQDDQGRKR